MATMSGYRVPAEYPTGFTSTPHVRFLSTDAQHTSSSSPSRKPATCGFAFVTCRHADRVPRSSVRSTTKCTVGVFGSE